MPTLLKLWAFIKRDFRQTVSYRLNFIFSILGVFFSCVTFFFLSRLVEGRQIPSLAAYGGEYFSFVLVGIAFSSFLSVGLQSLADSISRAQTTGTLEALLVTPTNMTTVIFSSSLFAFLFAAVRVLVYFAFGILIFGVTFPHANIPLALGVFALSTAAFTAMGMISASFVMVFKQGNPAGWIFGGVSTLFGGVIFPVDILPRWLQPVSSLLPLTHALEAMRRTLLTGEGLSELWRPILTLALFTAALIPIGVLSFWLAVRWAKKTGSLVQY